MFPDTFTLLQNEGYLMQGCLKQSLARILAIENAQPDPYYAAFFDYTIGLERTLKLILLLDKWHTARQFLTNEDLRAKGHNLFKLHREVLPLFQQYGVPFHPPLDNINTEILKFLADFANGSRYYNLNALAGADPAHAINPIFRWQRLFYQVYQQDDPKAERITCKPDVPEDEMPDNDLWAHHCIMAAARKHICWRLVQLLIPLKSLLTEVSHEVHGDDQTIGGPGAGISVPFMEEFLDFVCDDKTIVDDPEEWP